MINKRICTNKPGETNACLPIVFKMFKSFQFYLGKGEEKRFLVIFAY